MLPLLVFCLSGYAQPRAEVIDAKKSFGRVLKGEQVKLRYLVVNRGDQPLILKSVEVSCECTSAKLPGKPVLPGDTAEVHVSFDTKSAYGVQDRTVILQSNDPGPPAALRFRGNVRRK